MSDKSFIKLRIWYTFEIGKDTSEINGLIVVEAKALLRRGIWSRTCISGLGKLKEAILCLLVL